MYSLSPTHKTERNQDASQQRKGDARTQRTLMAVKQTGHLFIKTVFYKTYLTRSSIPLTKRRRNILFQPMDGRLTYEFSGCRR
jgi:hypothetical protein